MTTKTKKKESDSYSRRGRLLSILGEGRRGAWLRQGAYLRIYHTNMNTDKIGLNLVLLSSLFNTSIL